MREIFKQNNIFLLLFIMLIFSCKVNAQGNENEKPPEGFEDGDQLNEVPVGGYVPPDNSWDHASLYWNTEPNYDTNTNMGDGYIPPPPIIKKTGDEKELKRENYELTDQNGDKLTKSEIVLTKKVKPGETHTQSVKVLRDISNSAEKKVVDLIVNGVKVGTVTFSAPLRDAKGVDIYSKMTVQVFNNSPMAITKITFGDPGTSNYEGSPHSTDGNRKEATTDLSVYQTLGIIDFTTPINDNENIIFTGSITAANDSSNKKDPCLVAKELTTLSANPVFNKAVQDIRNTPDFYKKEYSISLGKNSNGNIYGTTIEPGEESKVEVNYTIQGFFASMHNHPSYSIHSGIDLFNITFFNKLYPNFTAGFLLPNKEQVYAAVVTDLEAAQDFVATYLTDPKTKLGKHYPKHMVQEISSVFEGMDSYAIEAEARAKAYVLGKYNSGISFFRQGGDGKFYPLKIKETKQINGLIKYELIPCI
ncbi:hypothetical protein K6T82_18845 [Flavobacterium sp. 17A]|uniref:Thiol-activated cytolysin n=1 Tax=Flavobacterium potami TaxID=2872310 RepID=A0A9X1KRR9_9FLAO|nr:hypothetical protein [Flavobacterium potami]MBZ4036835.1 hypothetical protein [Flavobacterium potami]